MTASQTSLWALALSTLPEKNQRFFKISSTSSPDIKQTLNNILSVVEVQRDRCTRDKWTTISFGGKELIIRDICAKIAAHVKKFMNVADVAVQYDPIHAALPWAGVRFLLQLTFSGFEVFGAIVEGLEKAAGLIARCGILEALFIRNGRVLNLTSRASIQESVTQMEATEQHVLALMGLIDSQSPSQQRWILLEFLEEIQQRCRDVVKIFVSSRYEDIAVWFKKGEILEVTSQANYEYLKKFVEIEVERFVKRWSSMHDESTAALQKLGEDIKKALMTGAQGMFLWVTLQLESISDTEHVKDIDSIRQVLTSLPPTLGKSYEAIYKRIDSMGESTRRVAIQSFQWLLCAERTLSVSEFVAAMGMSSSQLSHVSARSIRDYCCSLVIIDNEADTFHLAHLTVREFLETLPEFSIDESNATVANRCLRLYLGDERESDILSYATWHWPAHVEQLSGSPQRAAIKPALLKFFTEEEHFEDWLDDLDELPIEEGPSWSNSLHRKLSASFASPPSALFMISCFGLEEVLESCELARTTDVNQRNRHDTSALYLSARWGHVAVTQILLDLGAAIDAPGSQYGNALQAASFAGQEGILNILLEKGASFFPDESSLAGQGEYSSPLQAALANGHDRVAQLLIDRGCKLTIKKQFDDAIDTASSRGNVDIVERLLSGKAGVFTPNIVPDPLQVALFGGKARQAKRLIQEYGDGRIDEEIGYFGNALAAAIASRKLGLVQLVVDAGANLDARGRFGSPVRSTVISDHLGIARYLLKKGVNPNAEDKNLGDLLQAAASLES
ncbi:hypothetical protein N7463_005100 [Penicillium fimorum]|uniref:GPI inositol-deacylase winged helix domain-containing protein n=1 Tax=Penicillium fimorum TaxID=1882269 RepID=A0A9W9XSS4_9EURO|nr:hypothetical protein N7463_005100 [Penicillium fimorum]